MDVKEAIIRTAQIEDIGQIIVLNENLLREDAGQWDSSINMDWVRKHGKEYFSRLIMDEDGACLVAVIEGNEVGYVAGHIVDTVSIRPIRRAEIQTLFVQEEFRSQGVGTRLVAAFIEWSRRKGAEKVTVSAYASNERAILFYRRLGFQPRLISLENDIEASCASASKEER